MSIGYLGEVGEGFIQQLISKINDFKLNIDSYYNKHEFWKPEKNNLAARVLTAILS